MAHEIIKKSEKDTHDARAEARRAEEAAEREKRIGIVFWLLASPFVFVASNWLTFPTSAELSIVDEVVNKLLNEVAEKVLKEEL
jgi:hypothetical protein